MVQTALTVNIELVDQGLEKGAQRVAGRLGGLKKAADQLGAAIREAFAVQRVAGFAKACIELAGTEGSFAEETRLLARQWQEFMALLGGALATVLLPAVQVLGSLVAVLTEAGRAVNALLGAVFGREGAAVKQNAALAKSAAGGAAAQRELAQSTRQAAEAANDALAPFDELNVIQKERAAAPAAGKTPAGGKAPALAAGAQVKDALSPQLQAIAAKIRQLLEPLREIDFTPLAEALGRLKEAAAPLARTLFAGLEWAYYNLFVPLAAWTAEDLLPAFLDLLAAGLGVLNSVLQALQPLAVWLWESFLQPLAAWAGGAVIEWLELLTAALNGLAEWLQSGVLEPVAALAAEFWLGVTTLAQEAWQSLEALWGGAAGWFSQTVIAPVANHFGLLFTAVKGVFQGLIAFLSGAFSGDWKKAWEGIKKIFGSVWEGITGIAKNAVNGVIGFINGMIGAVERAVNAVIHAVNHFSFELPDWEIFGDLAGKSFGLNIPGVSLGRIPQLAQGAVLPANKPFLALVGDQKRGTSVEAPVETIQQAVAEVLARMGGRQEFTASAPIEVSLDGEVLYRAMERIRVGRGAEIGGAFANAY